MKKRIVYVLLAVIICLSIASPVCAAGVNIRLVDNADLLTTDELSEILISLNTVSQKHEVDLVIVTTDSIGYKTPAEYADDFFDNNEYGYGPNRDGVLLLISMADSDWYISTSGYGITAFTDAGIDYIGEQITPYLSDGDFADAFREYITLCDDFITTARNGSPYTSQTLPKEPFEILPTVLVSIVIGFAVAFIATGIMKGQLKTIRSQSGAADYIKSGSMNISDARDLFLYRNVSRRPKPQSSSSGSSTHRSSSGRTHGGGGGKF